MNKKRKPFWNHDVFYYICIVIAIYAYVRFCYVRGLITELNYDVFTKIVTTCIALISAVTFWLQFKRTERLNESNFVMNMNKQFIDSKDMTKVEHELELFYNQYLSCYKKQTDKAGKEINVLDIKALKRINLGLSQSRTSEDCQKLINYLVYLESMAIMVENGVLHLGVIDDLFSYRFFLAVNNPIVQEGELLPYADFYQGTYKLSEMWIKQHRKNHIPIPMEEFCLTRGRLEEYEIYHEKKKTRQIDISKLIDTDRYIRYNKIQLHCSFARGDDDKEKIADCIYQTDRFIYPEAFGSDRKTAVKAISRVIGMDDSLFDFKNLFVARYNGEICGVALLYDGTTKWNTKKVSDRIASVLPDGWEEGFNYASKEYFEKIGNQKLNKNTIEIVAFCIDEGFRSKGFGKAFMKSLFEMKDSDGKLMFDNKTFILDVLEENKNAIEMYAKCGYNPKEPTELFEGFSPKGTRKKPQCFEMRFDNTEENRNICFPQ